jgi:hypothetical protein
MKTTLQDFQNHIEYIAEIEKQRLKSLAEVIWYAGIDAYARSNGVEREKLERELRNWKTLDKTV